LKIRPAPRPPFPPAPYPNGLLAEPPPPWHIETMEPLADRRAAADRRTSEDRRQGVVRVPVEHRAGTDRRSGGDRRGPQSLGDQIRNALELLTNVAESGTLDDAGLRDLDAAVFRLRFVLDRFERTSTSTR
jgi:hypothetical protein